MCARRQVRVQTSTYLRNIGLPALDEFSRSRSFLRICTGELSGLDWTPQISAHAAL